MTTPSGSSKASTILARFSGGALAFTAVVTGGLGVFVVGYLRDVMEDLPQETELPQLAQAFFDHPALIALLAIPSLLLGLILLFSARGRWLLVCLGLLTTLVPLAAVLYCLISVLAPWYEVQPL